uniref:NAD-dependent epimerase/dehydratase domain-containing protein n=1 Tax=Opuntia streptacantha TaxID=393608 RepID=A0A7C8ZHI2_OPUST
MEKRVCVTGASGYIASWVVKLLLERGYTVHATVRSLKDPTKTEHLVCMDGARERLKLFEANLMQEGSFDAAVQGCHGVFHIASPVIFDSPNPQEDIIDPAVKGTLNVLASCAKVPTIKRVVLSSSSAAVLHNVRPLTPETVVDETWFSTKEGCEASYGKWYVLAKTMAEEAAWKFVKEKGMDMVSILPTACIGKFFRPTLNFAAAVILSLINDPDKYPNMALGWIHVKDVAEAHIRAFEIPSANGRYILSETVAYFSQIANILRELYPTLKISTKWEDNLEAPYQISGDKARSLGINYIPLRVGLKETVECLKEMKFLDI